MRRPAEWSSTAEVRDRCMRDHNRVIASSVACVERAAIGNFGVDATNCSAFVSGHVRGSGNRVVRLVGSLNGP